MSPFVWLGIAAAMALVEAFSLGLITLWFVVGALAAFAANLLGVDPAAQVLVFLIVSVVCLVIFRPVFMKYRNRGDSKEPTLVGQVAVVREAIDSDRLVGRVETPDHMTWAACSASGEPLPVGQNVVVVGQESVKLIVERKLP